MWIITSKKNISDLAIQLVFTSEESAQTFLDNQVKCGNWAGSLYGKFAVREIKIHS
jgi:hypothetical protein